VIIVNRSRSTHQLHRRETSHEETLNEESNIMIKNGSLFAEELQVVGVEVPKTERFTKGILQEMHVELESSSDGDSHWI